MNRVARFTAALLLIAAVGAIWRWTALSEWVALGEFVRSAREAADTPWAALVVAITYAAGALIAFPMTVLVVVTGLLFEPLLGGLYAYGGAMLSAAITYGLGASLGRHTVRRLAGYRLNRITRRLARRGVFAVALIRLLPIASYWNVNIVAGASYIRMRDFLLGTAFGIATPTALTVVFVDRARAAIYDPGIGTLAALAAVAAILVGGAVLIWRRFGQDEPVHPMRK